MDVAVIGGGAAGFFAAIHARLNHPAARVVLFEKSGKLLSKVRVSGGGRCNVTNGCTDVNELWKAYPRGGRRLKKAFNTFGTIDTRAWFESRGVPLYVQDDQRVFPVSDNSQSIIDCLLNEARRLGITIEKQTPVKYIKPDGEKLLLGCGKPEAVPRTFDRVVVATGGAPTKRGLTWLSALGHTIASPLPSLFTFNMPKDPVTRLMGVVADPATAAIQGTRLSASGPILITHWGMSGPAILKLSAFGARELAGMDYQFNAQINWVHEKNQAAVMEHVTAYAMAHPKKMLANGRLFDLPAALWKFLIEKAGIPADRRWGDTGRKLHNRLVNVLTNDVYPVRGKTTFKEEFVTCGGVSLDSIDLATMQSKVCKNLYFAGEVLDIDAITGGYNFQAAWTTGFIAGKLG
ncbi:MAG: NAD(P)/FAD-dependent oxidoreductase [Bacteroidota bacterium]